MEDENEKFVNCCALNRQQNKGEARKKCASEWGWIKWLRNCVWLWQLIDIVALSNARLFQIMRNEKDVKKAIRRKISFN